MAASHRTGNVTFCDKNVTSLIFGHIRPRHRKTQSVPHFQMGLKSSQTSQQDTDQYCLHNGNGKDFVSLVQVCFLLRGFFFLNKQVLLCYGSRWWRISRQLGPRISKNLAINQDPHQWGRTNLNFKSVHTTQPPGHKPLVVNVVVVGPFKEEEEGIVITSDVVKVSLCTHWAQTPVQHHCLGIISLPNNLFSEWSVVGTGNGNREHVGHGSVQSPREAAGGWNYAASSAKKNWDVVAHRRACLRDFRCSFFWCCNPTKSLGFTRKSIEDLSNM